MKSHIYPYFGHFQYVIAPLEYSLDLYIKQFAINNTNIKHELLTKKSINVTLSQCFEDFIRAMN